MLHRSTHLLSREEGTLGVAGLIDIISILSMLLLLLDEESINTQNSTPRGENESDRKTRHVQGADPTHFLTKPLQH